MPYTTVQPETLDGLLAEGWRILSKGFVRHSHALAVESAPATEENWCRTIPVRIDLRKYYPSKSQRKLLRRNNNLSIETGPIQLSQDKHLLFDKHYVDRFNEYNPINVFLRQDSAIAPSTGIEFCVYHNKKLIAYSTIHIGEGSISSTYAFHDPGFPKQSLGIFTMLLEINYALEQGKRYFYPGYIYDKPSRMDYKRNFFGMEYYNWQGVWAPMERGASPELPEEWPDEEAFAGNNSGLEPFDF